MKTKQEHINYWIESAGKEEEMIALCFEGKQYVYALFFGHLYLEKILKALWIKTHDGNVPPKTHNLMKLVVESKLTLDNEFKEFLVVLNNYNIEGRYATDIRELYSITSLQLTKDYLKTIKQIQQCILNNLL